MASGRINRNGPEHEARGALAGISRNSGYTPWSCSMHRSRYRSGDTELPRLTSDPIVYGGPQGWNPHFLRTSRLPREGIKPFEPRESAASRANRSETTERVERPVNRVVLCAHYVRSTLVHLRASDSVDAGNRIRRTVSRSDVMGLYYLNPSNRYGGNHRPITQPTFLRAGSRPEGARRHRAAPFTLHRNRVIYLRPSNYRHTVPRYHATVFHNIAIELKRIARLEANRSFLATGVGSGWVFTAHVVLGSGSH